MTIFGPSILAIIAINIIVIRSTMLTIEHNNCSNRNDHHHESSSSPSYMFVFDSCIYHQNLNQKYWNKFCPKSNQLSSQTTEDIFPIATPKTQITAVVQIELNHLNFNLSQALSHYSKKSIVVIFDSSNQRPILLCHYWTKVDGNFFSHWKKFTRSERQQFESFFFTKNESIEEYFELFESHQNWSVISSTYDNQHRKLYIIITIESMNDLNNNDDDDDDDDDDPLSNNNNNTQITIVHNILYEFDFIKRKWSTMDPFAKFSNGSSITTPIQHIIYFEGQLYISIRFKLFPVQKVFETSLYIHNFIGVSFQFMFV